MQNTVKTIGLKYETLKKSVKLIGDTLQGMLETDIDLLSSKKGKAPIALPFTVYS